MKSSSRIVYPALQSLLTAQLQKALKSLRPSFFSESGAEGLELMGPNCLEQSNSPLSKPQPILEIPLNKVKDLTQVQYVSAIAFKLAKPWDRQPMELAQEIATELLNLTKKAEAMFDQLPLDRVWQNFDVQTVSPGWIHLGLRSEGLAAWLQLLNTPLCSGGDRAKSRVHFENDNQFFRNSTNLFEIQYNYARSSSLLRLGAQIGTIKLNHPLQEDNPTGDDGYITEPYPIPWLTPKQSLRLSHPLEHRLIAQAVTVLDELSSFPPPAPVRVLKLAQALTQAFQAFEAGCRIWGELLSTDRELAQARLGLVAVSRSILQWMLVDWLSAEAPVEL